jgi:hypothetical protein
VSRDSTQHLVEDLFSKLAELKDRIMAVIDYFNRDSVVHIWSYITEAASDSSFGTIN